MKKCYYRFHVIDFIAKYKLLLGSDATLPPRFPSSTPWIFRRPKGSGTAHFWNPCSTVTAKMTAPAKSCTPLPGNTAKSATERRR